MYGHDTARIEGIPSNVMRWNQGHAEIDRLLADRELQRVPPNREHADQLFAQARKDLASAELLLDALTPLWVRC
jgi:uncharacterized protein (DUF3084 family)